MIKLSAFIVTYNEALHIAKALNSLKSIVGEIIVVDNGSTDKTVEIARNMGAKVVFYEYHQLLTQKFLAEDLCQNDWVINIKANEELSKELQDEIEFIFASNMQDRYFAYQIKSIILHYTDKKVRSFAPSIQYIRLYNRKYSSFANNFTTFNGFQELDLVLMGEHPRSSTNKYVSMSNSDKIKTQFLRVEEYSIHDTASFKQNIDPENKIYNLNGIIYHRPMIPFQNLLTKINFFSTIQVIELLQLQKTYSKIKIITNWICYFFKIFFISRYFIFGFDGFIYSVIFAFAHFVRLAKLRELMNEQKSLHK